MTSYKDTIAAARRLAILLALYFAPGYTLPRRALREQVERTGYVTSADLLDTELSWLAEQRCVEELAYGSVCLSLRGEDIALGRSQAPGICRPAPGEPPHGPQ